MSLDAQPPEEASKYRESRPLVLILMVGGPMVWLALFVGAAVAAGYGDRLLPANLSTLITGGLVVLTAIGWIAYLNAKTSHRNVDEVRALLQDHVDTLSRAKLTELVDVTAVNGKPESPHLRSVTT
jgi:hypothetical protein